MTKAAEALDTLRTQGYVVAEPDVHTGRVRIWMRGVDEAVDVEHPGEVRDLAEGKLTFEEIQARREDEAGTWQE